MSSDVGERARHCAAAGVWLDRRSSDSGAIQVFESSGTMNAPKAKLGLDTASVLA
jgi:hypothetical protein